MCRGCVRVTVLKLSVRLGVGGRPGSVIVWAGDPDFGVASAANLYETVASDDRVVAGRFPGSKNEKGNPCDLFAGRTRGVGMNTQGCKTFDRVAHVGHFFPIGRRVVTSITNLISNFATSKFPS